MEWTGADIPDLRGRTAIVTGSNTGIGLETAAALAGARATVVLACRDHGRAEGARAGILSRRPGAAVELLRLDLASQAQIAHAAAEACERFPRIDVLVNNAGVLGLPRALTEDGVEVVFGTNHLGHFAFTGRVLPSLEAAPAARVVTVSSLSQRVGRIRWDDLHGSRRYGRFRAYAQSKLANLMFTLELQRRLARTGSTASSLAAHPGMAATDILGTAREGGPQPPRGMGRFVQSAADAALPSLRAATDPGAYGGQFYGPSGPGGTAGPPAVCRPSRRALCEDDQQRLWIVSEELTGVVYPFAGGSGTPHVQSDVMGGGAAPPRTSTKRRSP